MKTRLTIPSTTDIPADFPDADALAALRAWYEGASSRDAAYRYLHERLSHGQSARGVIGQIRRQLALHARNRQRADLAMLFECPTDKRMHHARATSLAVELLRTMPAPAPQIGDDIVRWLPARAVRTLNAAGIRTLTDLTVRIPRRRQWWAVIPGLGPASARRIEAFFAAHPALTERARALIVADRQSVVTPWEQLRLPHEVDGSAGAFRAPASSCTLGVDNDYEAIQAWLALHESPATQRAYRKEAERLILWAIAARGKALSSLTTRDATDYRAFLRRPTPRERWVGPPRPRTSPDWRPFVDNLSARSIAHALAVLGALFRWLVEQRYVVANPFAGIKVRGSKRAMALETAHAFTEGEWLLTRAIANGLECSYGWQTAAAQRLRFMLDFGYATGLRISELASATLRSVEADAAGDHWLHVIGKGGKPARVTLTPLARTALDRYLQERGLPVSRALWNPATPLIGSLDADADGIKPLRLWEVMRRFFRHAAQIIENDHPALTEKLRQATPHWMRHTHATHAIAKGVELSAVRDNLRHASIAITSIYLHTDDVKRARQFRQAFTG
ncbi:tyrosine-type recombinase/integrase [Burkholderia sp. Ac-20384]|uniref:site-specific integrase n=1 Tax=Burkholderia sp. Ac-20384 TaxID=2703902 RepID=UPI00197ED81E|nr:site-specific integrase [Burkholderia sp. Ac-20384]MBN3827867.1 tyrosine-type recombinase/integrase [Burkholderia sp. Ac-20384]